MDVARLNMSYFEASELEETVEDIKAVSSEVGKDCPIMVDLKGPIIRTLPFRDGLYQINVAPGQEVRISSNRAMKGEEGMFVIDYPNIHELLNVGDQIVIDYGGALLTVVNFELEERYLFRRD
mmetsp:Transcript_32090/g.31404  ORF Transcript_32090/g.31404 Transcript_32090/m.31404 type:complete len:123 (-) Transcript_32090:108-476(-)